MICAPTLKTGFSALIGPWKTIRNVRPAELAHLGIGHVVDVPAFIFDRAFYQLLRRHRNQPHYRAGPHRFPGSILANKTEGFTPVAVAGRAGDLVATRIVAAEADRLVGEPVLEAA